MSRKSARKWTMKCIYEMTMNEFSESRVKDFVAYHNIPPEESEYLTEVTESLLLHLADVDQKIQDYSMEWKINRISKIDLSILRLAITEILFLSDIPPSVSVNEAVELAKEFSAAHSFKYINGLLASVIKDTENENI